MGYGLTRRRSQPPLALAVPLSRFTSRVGGGSAFFVSGLGARIENIDVTTRTINSGVCHQFGRVVAMNTNPRITTLLTMLAVLLSAFALLASETPTTSDL